MKIIYVIANALLSAIARLPFRVLYFIADIIFILIYHIVRYRRRLVDRNISLSFPGITAERLRTIRRQFYHNLADYFVETIKLAHVTDEQMRRRMTFENIELIDRFIDQGRSVAIYFSHCVNWEWAPSVTLWSKHAGDPNVDFCQVYRPLANAFIDRWFLGLRSRFHSISLAKRHVAIDLLKIKRAGRISVTGFMSDQKPSHQDPIHIVNFLGRPTAVITGTETLARRMDMAVIYWDMYKERRGHYRIVSRLITETPGQIQPYGITHSYISLLEKTITRNPAIWLWTHNRWKQTTLQQQ